jgi:hypothetical protein
MARWFVFSHKPNPTGDRPAPVPKRRIAGFQTFPTKIKPRTSTSQPLEGSSVSSY